MEKYILSEMKDKNFSKAVNEIYILTDYNKKQYPNYYKWYFEKNVVRVLNKTGETIFYLNGLEVAALAILKKDNNESKICTLMVNQEYQKKGYSKLILEDSFNFLKTDKPLITIPKNRLDDFSKIINAYNWKESETTDIYFTPEIVFNDKKLTLKK